MTKEEPLFLGGDDAAENDIKSIQETGQEGTY